MSAAQHDLIIRVNAALCHRFGLIPSTDTIVYHHWYDLNSGQRTGGSGSTKSCPGTAFFGGNSVAAAETGFIPLVQVLITKVQLTAAPLRTAEVMADSLNVRSGAGVNHAIIKKLRSGVMVEVYEETGGWLRIAADRQEWVNGRYVG